MLVLSEGVVKEFDPLTSGDPPLAIAYQSMAAPPGGVAVKVTVPGPHLGVLLAVGTAGTLFMVAVTAVLEGDIPPQFKFLACAK